MSKVNPIPDGYHTATPSLTIRDCARALDFYKSAFGATEMERVIGPGGKVWHATIRIGNSMIMMSDEFPERGALAPPSIGGTPVGIWLYVDDVDAAFQRAVEAGVEVSMPLSNMFWGDRMCALRDPFGHKWSLASRVEEVSDEEMERRQKEALAQWEAQKS